MDNASILEQFRNSYNTTPYKSYPYHKSSPENLCSLGTLFGVDPPPIETAKVLELGCSEGENLLPHAMNFPNSTFIGVDLSTVQIDTANNHVQKLGINNIKFYNCSITDINEDWGKFDYIIAHGVISWVPGFVREKIFSICSKNLSTHGIAYISYNALPGWNIINEIRAMMIYHTKNLDDPSEKVLKAKELLRVVINTLQDRNDFYTYTLRKEVIKISKHADYYIRHEYLEEENKQYYFHEFITEAKKQNLQYLSDCSLASMYLPNLPKEIVKVLGKIDEITELEQYMDFFTNRRFRSTLLVHNKIKIDRNLPSSIIKKFTLTASIRPEQLISRVNLDNTQENLKFFCKNTGKERFIFSNSPVLKSVLYALSENLYNPLTFGDLIKVATNNLDIKHEVDELGLSTSLVDFLLKGFINISLLPGNKNKTSLVRPKLIPYAYYQVTTTSNTWITNLMHRKISIDTFDKVFLKYMNGENTQDQIVNLVVQKIKNGKMKTEMPYNNFENTQLLKKKITYYLQKCLKKLSSKGLFV